MQNTITTWAPTPDDPIQVFYNLGIIILIIASVAAVVVRVYMIGFPEIEKGQTRKPQLGVIILVILAILSPEAIRIYPGSSSLAAMWLDYILTALDGSSYHSSFFFAAIPITLLRLVFPLMMYRYYRGMTSRRNVIISGVLVELPMLIFGYPLLILLIVGLVIIGFVPVSRRLVSWSDNERSGEQ